MVRWLRWHCPPDTGFEIRALAVWGRARYLLVTEAPHNTDFHTWMGKKHFCFFQTAETGNRTLNSGVKCSGANHYPRAPALVIINTSLCTLLIRFLYIVIIRCIDLKSFLLTDGGSWLLPLSRWSWTRLGEMLCLSEGTWWLGTNRWPMVRTC